MGAASGKQDGASSYDSRPAGTDAEARVLAAAAMDPDRRYPDVHAHPLGAHLGTRRRSLLPEETRGNKEIPFDQELRMRAQQGDALRFLMQSRGGGVPAAAGATGSAAGTVVFSEAAGGSIGTVAAPAANPVFAPAGPAARSVGPVIIQPMFRSGLPRDGAPANTRNLHQLNAAVASAEQHQDGGGSGASRPSSPLDSRAATAGTAYGAENAASAGAGAVYVDGGSRRPSVARSESDALRDRAVHMLGPPATAAGNSIFSSDNGRQAQSQPADRLLTPMLPGHAHAPLPASVDLWRVNGSVTTIAGSTSKPATPGAAGSLPVSRPGSQAPITTKPGAAAAALKRLATQSSSRSIGSQRRPSIGSSSVASGGAPALQKRPSSNLISNLPPSLTPQQMLAEMRARALTASKPSLKGYVAGPPLKGQLFALAAYKPTPMPLPPVRPESFGGLPAAVLRPFPIYLLHRMFLKARINPSPAFRIRFYKIHNPGLLAYGQGIDADGIPQGFEQQALLRDYQLNQHHSDGSAFQQQQQLQHMPIMHASAADNGSLMSDSMMLSLQGSHTAPPGFHHQQPYSGHQRHAAKSDGSQFFLTSGGTSHIQQQQQQQQHMLPEFEEVYSGPTTDHALSLGHVRCVTDSNLIMRTSVLRHTAACATDWRVYIPALQDAFLDGEDDDIDNGIHGGDGHRPRHSKRRFQMRMGDDGLVILDSIDPAAGDGADGDDGATPHGGVPRWANDEKGFLPNESATGSAAQASVLGLDRGVFGESASSAGILPGTGVGGNAAHNDDDYDRDPALGQKRTRPLTSSDLYHGPSPLAVEAARLQELDDYWTSQPWKESWQSVDLESQGGDKAGIRLCACGCGKAWGRHSSFPSYTGGGFLRGHEANGYEGSANHIKQQVLMGATSVLVLHPGFVVDTPCMVLDLSSWGVDEGTIAMIATHSRTIRVLKLSNWQGPLFSPEMLVALAYNMPQLRHLHLPGCDAWGDPNVCSAIASSPLPAQLLSLDISFSSITDEGLIILTKKMTNLKTLSMGSCPYLTSRGLMEAGKSLRSLATLDAAWSPRIDGFAVAAVLSECAGMRRLSLRGMGRAFVSVRKMYGPQPSDFRPAGPVESAGTAGEVSEGVYFSPKSRSATAASALNSAQQHKPLSLNIASAAAAANNGPNTDEQQEWADEGVSWRELEVGTVGDGLGGRPFLLHRVLGARVELLVHLHEVDLEACVGVTDAVVISLVRNTECALKKLRLNHNVAITAASTTAIALFCPKLTHIHLLGCTGVESPIFDASIAATLSVQTGLDRNGGVIPDPSSMYGAGFGIASKMKQLEKAGPRHSGLVDAVVVDTGSDFGSGLGIGHKRPDVHLSGEAGPPKPKWTRLQVVDFTGCAGIWEVDVASIIETCGDLTDLRLTGCHQVTDYCFPSMTGSTLMLRSLSLAHLPALSDVGLCAIADACPDLRCLDVSGCTGFTDKGLDAFARRCLQLRELRANGCSDTITLGVILKLARACRMLRVLEVGRSLIGNELASDVLQSGSAVSEGASVWSHVAHDTPFAANNGAGAPAADHRSSASAPTATSGAPLSRDTSFAGDTFEFLLCLGISCPYLEQLDLTGRKAPGGSSNGVLSAEVKDAVARAARLLSAAIGADLDADFVSHAGVDASHYAFAAARSGAAGAAAGIGADKPPTHHPKRSQNAKGRDVLRGEIDPDEVEILLPRLNRAVLKHCGHISPEQLASLLKMCPNLLSLDLTDTAGVTAASVQAAITTSQNPFVRLVAQNCDGAEGLKARAANVAAHLGIQPVPIARQGVGRAAKPIPSPMARSRSKSPIASRKKSFTSVSGAAGAGRPGSRGVMNARGCVRSQSPPSTHHQHHQREGSLGGDRAALSPLTEQQSLDSNGSGTDTHFTSPTAAGLSAASGASVSAASSHTHRGGGGAVEHGPEPAVKAFDPELQRPLLQRRPFTGWSTRTITPHTPALTSARMLQVANSIQRPGTSAQGGEIPIVLQPPVSSVCTPSASGAITRSPTQPQRPVSVLHALFPAVAARIASASQHWHSAPGTGNNTSARGANGPVDGHGRPLTVTHPPLGHRSSHLSAPSTAGSDGGSLFLHGGDAQHGTGARGQSGLPSGPTLSLAFSSSSLPLPWPAATAEIPGHQAALPVIPPEAIMRAVTAMTEAAAAHGNNSNSSFADRLQGLDLAGLSQLPPHEQMLAGGLLLPFIMPRPVTMDPTPAPSEFAVQATAEQIMDARSALFRKPQELEPYVQEDTTRALGFEPIPGACFLREAQTVQKRIALERISANRIRKVVRHGLRKERDWFWVLRFQVRVRVLARANRSVRRIQRAYRSHVQFKFWKKHMAATLIQMFWRGLVFIDRCRQRILAALEVRRAAQTKQLAASLFRLSTERVQVRMSWDRLRMNALIERWKDERRINRLRGMGPVYGPDGKLKVQFAFPVLGDEVLGEKEEMLEQINTMEIILRANQIRPLSGLDDFAPRARHMLGNGSNNTTSSSAAAPSTAAGQRSDTRERPTSADSIGEMLGLGPGRDIDRGPADDGWEYAYAYQYEGLRLKDPKRVRRRKSLVAMRLQRMREEQASQYAALAAEDAFVRSQIDAEKAADESMPGGPSVGDSVLYEQVSQQLVVRLPNVPGQQQSSGGGSGVDSAVGPASVVPPRSGPGSLSDPSTNLTSLPGKLPHRPHRPRRNSFDLISLARIHPDEPEYSDGWETCDSEGEDYQELYGYYHENAADDAANGASSAAMRAAGQVRRRRGTSPSKRMPNELGTSSLLELADQQAADAEAAELAAIDIDYDTDLTRQKSGSDLLRSVASQKDVLAGTIGVYADAASHPAALQQYQDGDLLVPFQTPNSKSAKRPESAFERHIRRTRDFYLRKLARLHMHLSSIKQARERQRAKLTAENWTERDLRRARDAYEATHGAGSSAKVQAWAQLDEKMQHKITGLFALENRISAVEREINNTAQILKMQDKRLLLTRRARELRQAAVTEARTADPGLLALDHGTAIFRLSDDAAAKLHDRYGSSLKQHRRLSALLDRGLPASMLEAAVDRGSYSIEEEKKGSPEHDRHQQQANSSSASYQIVGTRNSTLDAAQRSVADVSGRDSRFQMPSSSSGRPGPLEGRSAGTLSASAADGAQVDPRDAAALAVRGSNSNDPRGMRLSSLNAVAAITRRPLSASTSRMLPVKHSPHAILPGGVRVILPNPQGIGGEHTEDFGTGPIKRTALSRVLRAMGVEEEYNDQTSLIGPLHLATRPLEQLTGMLGPMVVIQNSKRRLPVELAQYLREKKAIEERKAEIEVGAARRLRFGVARRIQRMYRIHLASVLIEREMKKFEETSMADIIARQRRAGKADPPNCATASPPQIKACVIIQAAFRSLSARLFYLRARRTMAVNRAKELLKQVGSALDAPDAEEYVRATVLAGEVQKQLQVEQSFTRKMRRASIAFDREMRAADAEGLGVSDAERVLTMLSKAIQSGAQVQTGPSVEEEFSQHVNEFRSAAVDDDILGDTRAGGDAESGSFSTHAHSARAYAESVLRGRKRRKPKGDPLRLAYNELAVLLSLNLDGGMSTLMRAGNNQANTVVVSPAAASRAASVRSNASVGTAAHAVSARAASLSSRASGARPPAGGAAGASFAEAAAEADGDQKPRRGSYYDAFRPEEALPKAVSTSGIVPGSAPASSSASTRQGGAGDRKLQFASASSVRDVSTTAADSSAGARRSSTKQGGRRSQQSISAAATEVLDDEAGQDHQDQSPESILQSEVNIDAALPVTRSDEMEERLERLGLDIPGEKPSNAMHGKQSKKKSSKWRKGNDDDSHKAEDGENGNEDNDEEDDDDDEAVGAITRRTGNVAYPDAFSEFQTAASASKSIAASQQAARRASMAAQIVKAARRASMSAQAEINSNGLATAARRASVSIAIAAVAAAAEPPPEQQANSGESGSSGESAEESDESSEEEDTDDEEDEDSGESEEEESEESSEGDDDEDEDDDDDDDEEEVSDDEDGGDGASQAKAASKPGADVSMAQAILAVDGDAEEGSGSGESGDDDDAGSDAGEENGGSSSNAAANRPASQPASDTASDGEGDGTDRSSGPGDESDDGGNAPSPSPAAARSSNTSATGKTAKSAARATSSSRESTTRSHGRGSVNGTGSDDENRNSRATSEGPSVTSKKKRAPSNSSGLRSALAATTRNIVTGITQSAKSLTSKSASSKKSGNSGDSGSDSGAGTRRSQSTKHSKNSRQARRKAELAAQAQEQRRQRYYSGQMPLNELVAFRSELDAAAFHHRLDTLHSRGITLEAWMYRFVTESLPLMAQDFIFRFDHSASEASEWARHWSQVCDYMQDQCTTLPPLTDPLMLLRRARLEFRVRLLSSKVNMVRAQGHQYADVALMFKRLEAWADRVQHNMLNRADKDRALVRRVRRQIPAARKVLEFLERRHAQLQKAYDIWSQGQAKRAKRAWRAADVMKEVLAERDAALESDDGDDDNGKSRKKRSALHKNNRSGALESIAEGSSSDDEDATDSDDDDGADGTDGEGGHRRDNGRRRDGGTDDDSGSQNNSDSEDTGSESDEASSDNGNTSASEGDRRRSGRRRRHRGRRGAALDAHAAGEAGDDAWQEYDADGNRRYDWKATDEWVLKEDAVGRLVYVHVPTGSASYEEPSEPPAGFTYPPLRKDRSKMISPSFIPTAVGAETAMPPPMISPSFIPSASDVGGNTSTGGAAAMMMNPSAIPTSTGYAASGAYGAASGPVPAPLQLDPSRVLAVLDDDGNVFAPDGRVLKPAAAADNSAVLASAGINRATRSTQQSPADFAARKGSGSAGTGQSDGEKLDDERSDNDDEAEDDGDWDDGDAEERSQRSGASRSRTITQASVVSGSVAKKDTSAKDAKGTKDSKSKQSTSLFGGILSKFRGDGGKDSSGSSASAAGTSDPRKDGRTKTSGSTSSKDSKGSGDKSASGGASVAGSTAKSKSGAGSKKQQPKTMIGKITSKLRSIRESDETEEDDSAADAALSDIYASMSMKSAAASGSSSTGDASSVAAGSSASGGGGAGAGSGDGGSGGNPGGMKGRETFDADESKAEIRWLNGERKLLKNSIHRMEAYLQAIFNQHLQRALLESSKMEELRDSLEKLISVREEQRRTETELLQVQFEVAAHSYYFSNKAALEALARSNASSNPRFGRLRPFTEYRPPKDLTTWEQARQKRIAELTAQRQQHKAHVEARREAKDAKAAQKQQTQLSRSDADERKRPTGAASASGDEKVGKGSKKKVTSKPKRLSAAGAGAAKAPATKGKSAAPAAVASSTGPAAAANSRNPPSSRKRDTSHRPPSSDSEQQQSSGESDSDDGDETDRRRAGAHRHAATSTSAKKALKVSARGPGNGKLKSKKKAKAKAGDESDAHTSASTANKSKAAPAAAPTGAPTRAVLAVGPPRSSDPHVVTWKRQHKIRQLSDIEARIATRDERLLLAKQRREQLAEARKGFCLLKAIRTNYKGENETGADGSDGSGRTANASKPGKGKSRRAAPVRMPDPLALDEQVLPPFLRGHSSVIDLTSPVRPGGVPVISSPQPPGSTRSILKTSVPSSNSNSNSGAVVQHSSRVRTNASASASRTATATQHRNVLQELYDSDLDGGDLSSDSEKEREVIAARKDPVLRMQRKREKRKKKKLEEELTRRQSQRAVARSKVVISGRVDVHGGTLTIGAGMPLSSTTAESVVNDVVAISTVGAKTVMQSNPVSSIGRSIGTTNFVDGGAVINGLATATVRGGRFGRFVKRAGDLARELLGKEAAEAEAQRVRLAEATIRSELAAAIGDAAGGLRAMKGELSQRSGSSTNPYAHRRGADFGESASAHVRPGNRSAPVRVSTAPGSASGYDHASAALFSAKIPGIDMHEWYIPRFRPAQAPPTRESARYYSVAGDGEEIGNPGFWYWGRNKGTVDGMFGVKIRFGVIGGYQSEEESGSVGSETPDDEYEAAPPVADLEHGRELAKLRAKAMAVVKRDRRQKRIAEMRRRQAEGKALLVGISTDEAAAQQVTDGVTAYESIVGRNADVERRRKAGAYTLASMRDHLGASDRDMTRLDFTSRSVGEWAKARKKMNEEAFLKMRADHDMTGKSVKDLKQARRAADGGAIGEADISDSEMGIGRRIAEGGVKNLNKMFGWEGRLTKKQLDAEAGLKTGASTRRGFLASVAAEDGDDIGTSRTNSESGHVAAAKLAIKKDSYRKVRDVIAAEEAAKGKAHAAAGDGDSGADEDDDDSKPAALRGVPTSALRAIDPAWAALARAAGLPIPSAEDLEPAAAPVPEATSADDADEDDGSDADDQGDADRETDEKPLSRYSNAVADDAADGPAWWNELGLDDEDITISDGHSDPSKRYRGFAGGIIYARTAEDYSGRLAQQEFNIRAKLKFIVAQREMLELRIGNLEAHLELASEKWKAYELPPSIKRLIQESTDATDMAKKKEWEEEMEKRALERKKAKDDAERDRKRRLGISEAEEKREQEAKLAKEEEERKERRKLGIPEPPPKDELAEFRVVRAGEEFQSGGFRGIVGPDGSLLEFAGDGTQFYITAWRARYRVKPWIVDAALIKFLQAKAGATMSDDELQAALMAEGAQALIRTYKMGGEELPLSGLQLAKSKLGDRREAAVADAAAKAAALAKANEEKLRKSLQQKRKVLQAKASAGKDAKDDKKKKSGKEAREDLQDQMKRMMRATRNLYYQAQKYMAEYKLRRNKALQQTVQAVRKSQQAALGALEGICELQWVFGVFQDADFASEQLQAFHSDKPFFLKLNFNLGTHEDPVYLWYMRTQDITQMISHMVWGPFQGDDPTATLLRSKGYSYVTHPALFSGTALWYFRGSGRPITGMTCTFDNSRVKLMEDKGFKQIEGTLKSDYINPNAKIWLRAGRQRRTATKATSEIVIETETAAIQAKIAHMEEKIAQSKEAKRGKGAAENQTLQEGLAMAKADFVKKQEEAEATKEENLARAAIEFMGLKPPDVALLRNIFEEMDKNGNGSLELAEFFKSVGVERTPIADSIFFFLDGSFNDKLTFASFLRTVCTFCMFGAKEMVTWCFSIVASNIIKKAEALHDPPKPGRAGARGIDRRRNRSIYWENAVAWSGLSTSDTQGKISVQAFAQLMYTIHAPTSAMALTAKRAIVRAEKMAVGGFMRLFQFRQLCSDYPTLLSPIFLLQTFMRQKFLGESWWASKRQLFSDARDVVKEAITIETRMKMLAREEEKIKKADEKRRLKDEDDRKKTGAKGKGAVNAKEAALMMSADSAGALAAGEG